MELSDKEKTTLEIFTSDAGAFEVVNKIAKDHIERQRDTFVRTSLTLPIGSNEEVGAKLRAFSEAIRLVEGIFREVGQFRKTPNQVEKNPGR